MSFTEIVMKEYGSRIWFIPDGEVPDPDTGDLYSLVTDLKKNTPS